MGSPAKILVLGIGNLLWADEGFGIRVVETLSRHYEMPDNVQLMDGGTQGIYLVHHILDAEVLVVFDAIDYGLAPGTLKQVRDTEVPRFMGAKKMSLHQTGFQEVLAMADMMGGYPEHVLLVGVQPEQLEDYGGSLTAVVKSRIEPAITLALDYLRTFGVEARQRPTPLPADSAPFTGAVNMLRYEQDRPSADAACRIGDARVLFGEDGTEQVEPENPHGRQ
jgi:hydrogenase maturation protease